MIMPTLSVILIGLLVGAIMAVAGSRGRAAVPWALLGAWIGFGAGAIVGVAADVILMTGIWVAIVGHAVALVGAVAGAARLGSTTGAVSRDHQLTA